ncbi:MULTISPECIES: EAL domain-containing protein [unclassified Neptuniibacter]|uniref:EAL domain-containing protein n=1 Tax=unclassified Neptuniibacter TaxID=2630693 RepID=UPI000C6ACC8A|nr:MULTISPECIES: EAL domain-containing protein [unclassified Neptuniibacter]MAY42302.1 GGDEF domain-containing protein [Oceanospirillaceae bacterium]|tara:strand:- start:8577 stop:11186 length:2610 start_codon:yes stop_codon:yes gene_type:complete
MWIELIKLIALLLAFTMLLTFVFRAVGKNNPRSSLLQGILFGFIAIVGMSMPVHFSTGVIIDPRSVLVSVAGLFGGPLTAIPAGILAGGYRLWLGGSGAIAGMLVVLLSTVSGLTAYYLRKANYLPVTVVNLFIFGLFSHFIALFGLFALPNEIMWAVIKNLSIPFFIIYPPMTIFLGYLINFIERKHDIEEQLVSSTAQLKGLFDASPDLMWLKDINGVYLMCNHQFAKFFGAPESEIRGQTDYDYVDETLANLFRAMDKKVIASGCQSKNEEWVNFATDGKDVLLETIKTPIYGSDGQIIGVLGVAHDITQRAQNEARLRQSAIVFESTTEGVIITDKASDILDVNQSFSEITGYLKEEVVGKNTRILSSGKHDDDFYRQMWNTVQNTGRWRGEVWNKRKDNTIYPEWLTISEVKNKKGEVIHYVAVFSDITSIKESQERLDHLAFHDALTGLPNRVSFNSKLEAALKHANRRNSKLAILFIDLDNFKNINDSFGHHAGDNLLKYIATGLKSITRKEDTVARIGGDEFIILFEDIDNTDHIIGAIEKIMTIISSKFEIEGHSIQVSASVGVSLFPMDGDNPVNLIRNADAAMYRAKEEGRNTFQFYTRDLTKKAFERVIMENELRNAIEKNEFLLFYQPQFNLSSQHIAGLESLVRWNHSTLGIVPPNKFITLAEESGLINQIGEWVINEACRQGKEWMDKGLEFGRIAVNISSVQINKNELVDIVSSALIESGLPPSRLELEVTEGAIMKKTDSAIAQLEQLRKMGIMLSVDDFGTGYSSLSYLKKLPISKLKIDMSFVQNIPDDNDDKAIVNAIISMGRSLGLTVIAEGIENKTQEAYLKDSKCNEGQGYLYSKPICAEEIERIL